MQISGEKDWLNKYNWFKKKKIKINTFNHAKNICLDVFTNYLFFKNADRTPCN